jgi:antagonist of KipI
VAGIAVLEILSPGILATIQDRGRLGSGRYGVAPSGALDGFALRVANLLVDNPEGEAAVELTLAGFKARVLNDITVAVTGADLGVQSNGEPLGLWRSHRLKKGDGLTFAVHHAGCRAYLSVGGGFELPELLGSRSTNLTAKFGGFKGRPLQRGDVLFANVTEDCRSAAGRHFDLNQVPAYRTCRDIRVVPGPQYDHFSDVGQDTFFNTWYRVAPQSDRTGIRLDGDAVESLAGMPASILSEGLIAGSVQIPGDGRPIILLAETVSGGYRKIATVISADLPLLGQLMAGDRVRFQAVSVTEARKALRRQEAVLARLRDRLL